MIKVFIADDHAVVREGIKRIIADTGDMTVAGEAANGHELLAQVGSGKWDVIVLDLAMPGMSGLEVLQDIRKQHPRLPVLVLSMYPEDQYAVRTLMAGASGYLHKGGPPSELVTAIRTAVTGRRYITSEVAEKLASHVDVVSDKPPHEGLSNREYQVLCLIGAGRSVSDIAQQLSLSVKTVSTYRRRVLEKLELRHNSELIRYAIKHGLVE
jgi:two-component system invasion response regulator UvrY